MSTESAADLLKSHPDLRSKLRELALTNFDKFLTELGVDQVQVVICAERHKDKSLSEISQALAAHGVRITRQAVGDRCKKC